MRNERDADPFRTAVGDYTLRRPFNSRWKDDWGKNERYRAGWYWAESKEIRFNHA